MTYYKLYSILLITLIVTGCAAKPPKTCYELRLEFTGVNSKQILCTDKPLTESYNFRRVATD